MIALLVAFLVAVGITDRLVARTATPVAAPSSDAFSALRLARSAHTESSAWFCAGGTGAQGGAPATIVLTNSGGRRVHGTLTAVSATGPGASEPSPWAGARSVAVTVPSDGQVALGAQQLGTTGWVAAAVVLDGGGVAVSESVQSPLGWSMAPCASSTATNWYFAHGATSEGGGLVLSLFNPDATDAVVNISLVSSTAGYLAPAAYQGIDIAPGSVVTENIGDHDPSDGAVATEVSTLSGAVVATELQSVGTPGDGGVSLTLGAPATASRWVFPQSTGIPGGTVAFHIFNPTPTPAEVSVVIGLSQGAGAEPLAMHIPAQSLVTLSAEGQTRIPTGVPYSLTFTSTGTGIVVSREVSAPSGSPAGIPEVGDTSGVPGGKHALAPACRGGARHRGMGVGRRRSRLSARHDHDHHPERTSLPGPTRAAGRAGLSPRDRAECGTAVRGGPLRRGVGPAGGGGARRAARGGTRRGRGAGLRSGLGPAESSGRQSGLAVVEPVGSGSATGTSDSAPFPDAPTSAGAPFPDAPTSAGAAAPLAVVKCDAMTAASCTGFP